MWGKGNEEMQIINSKMSENLIKNIENLIINLLKTNDKFSDICSKLSNSLIKLNGGDWHCFALKQAMFKLMWMTIEEIWLIFRYI